MLDPIHTNTTCVVKPGLTELKSETENWKTEFSQQDNLFLSTELII